MKSSVITNKYIVTCSAYICVNGCGCVLLCCRKQGEVDICPPWMYYNNNNGYSDYQRDPLFARCYNLLKLYIPYFTQSLPQFDKLSIFILNWVLLSHL